MDDMASVRWKGESMRPIELVPCLLELLENAFLEAIDHDCFLPNDIGLPGAPQYRGLASVRDFVGFVAGLGIGESATSPVVAPDLDLSQTFAELLQAQVSLPSGQIVPLDAVALADLCAPMIPRLFAEIQNRLAADRTGTETFRAAVTACGAGEPGELLRALDTALKPALCRHLLDLLRTRVGHRTLRSFFIHEPVPGRLQRWWPGATTDYGRALATHHVPTDFGLVDVTVRRYDNDANEVRAYEWQGLIGERTGGDVPLAACCGVAYAMPRERDGRGFLDSSDLVWAADCVADVDVDQVRAFLEQHSDDAETVIARSDMCFVWIWERQVNAAKGSGLSCLRATLSDLKKRFPRMATAVISTQPYQFRPPERMPMPAELQTEHLDAIDGLSEFALRSSQDLAMDLRLCVPRHDADPDSILKYLGELTIQDLWPVEKWLWGRLDPTAGLE